jgi:hypothetical protein
MFGIKTRLARLFAGLAYRRQFAPAGGRSLEDLPLKKKFRLDIPTYDGSGQVVHPDIFFDGEAGTYVLAFTPYPHTDDRFENPCVAVSDDGIRFREEKAGLNPLAPAPEKDHNDDPDISLHGGVYSLVYLETVRPDYQNVVVLQSRDRLAWERKVLYRQELAGESGRLLLSPAVVWEGERCRCFFVMGDYGRGHGIRSCSAADLEGLDFAGAEAVQVEGIPTGLMPWHLDVFADGAGGWLMLLTLVASDGGKGGDYSLHLARSRDFSRWVLDPKPLLDNCYRSSGFVRDGVLYVYFSSNFWADEWRTGLYKLALS